MIVAKRMGREERGGGCGICSLVITISVVIVVCMIRQACACVCVCLFFNFCIFCEFFGSKRVVIVYF